MTDTRKLTGQCYCGDVHYTVPDAFEYALNCHCSGCRRTTGAAFKSIAGIRREKFDLAHRPDALLIVGDINAHNAHCKKCGSFLCSVVRDGTYVHVAMGTLKDAPSISPSAHIFVGSKAPWFTITDDLPQYDGHIVKAQ